MQNVSILKRFYYRYLGIMYWLIHWTENHRVLGLRVGTIIKWLAFLFLVVTWVRRRGDVAPIITLLFFIWILFSYWRAKRSGYYRFVEDGSELLAVDQITPLPTNKHIPVCATGIFSLEDWEKNVVFKPAEYWQVPMGDHAIMVQHQPGRYLYQFISANLLHNLRLGWLLFGPHPSPAVSITFQSIWGPEFNELDVNLLGRSSNKPVEKIRTVYLSFDNEDFERAVWHNLLYDTRCNRSEHAASS